MTTLHPTTADGLRRVALEQFAAHGYHATSLQQIADAAGVSKASVLYHYSSKEALLEAVLAPAIDELDRTVDELERMGTDDESRRAFIERFVDFLLGHRLAVHIFVNQQIALVDMPIMERAGARIQRIGGHFERTTEDVEEEVRFGIALAGAAYLLTQEGQWKEGPAHSPDALRPVLIRILADLIGKR